MSILVEADALVLLSDVDAIYTRPPGEPGAERIALVTDGSELDDVTFGASASGVGTGGASTKVSAAQLAAASGTGVLVTSTMRVADALDGADIGTWFRPTPRSRPAG